MRTRTRGILLAEDGTRLVNKQVKGERIFERLGRVSQDDAETWLRERQAEITAHQANELREGDQQLWAVAAAKYLRECKKRGARSIETIAYHISILLPYIGTMPLIDVCNDSLEAFKDDRLYDDEVKNSTVNRSLEVVRTTLNRAARVWRHKGRPWLSTSPLIEMLHETQQARKPYPISWAEQAELFKQLPSHLERMALYTVNTGARDDNVCGLRWEWERPVHELRRSVFVIPAEEFKGQRPHVQVLNDVAWNIVQGQRGKHKEFVFPYRRERVKNFDEAPEMEYHRIGTMNNTGFQNARKAAGLTKVRVHDLRHTFGQRLREAGVADEDRRLLMGHSVEGDMAQLYGSVSIVRLVEQANKVQYTLDRTTLLRVVNG